LEILLCSDINLSNAGIAVNPQKTDLIKKLKGTDMDILDITELRDMAYDEAELIEPEFTEKICTAVEYRDGTLLDVVYQVNT